MWCQHCGQDVPATRPTAGAPLECARCQRTTAAEADHDDLVATAHVTIPSEQLLDRRADERMRQIGRSLRSPIAGPIASGGGFHHWVDTPHVESRAPRDNVARQANRRRARASDQRMQAFAWLATVFGMGLAAGGAVLMGMGLLGEQAVFWQWGVGVTLAGQAILIAGLVRVLISLWSASRNANRRVHSMQEELAKVQRTAESLVAQRPGGASGFYGDLARGVNPAVLLSNLKGQLDHLATRMYHDV